MARKALALALVFGLAVADQGPPVYQATGTAHGVGSACDGDRVQIETATGQVWACRSGSWQLAWDPNQQFVLQRASPAHPNAIDLSSLGTGLLLNTAYVGVRTVKAANACTNQFARSDTASGVWTCAAVNLSNDTAATALPATKGGTGLTTTTAGGVLAGTATNTTAFSAAGTNTLQVLHSGVTGLPTWGYLSVNSISTTNVASASNYLRGDGVWAAIPSHYVSVPAAANTTCTAGDYAFDSSYLYACHTTDTWVRSAAATW